MNFNKIIIPINLILMIYSCNAVIVDNYDQIYDQIKYNEKSLESLQKIEKIITTITITDENDNTIHVNAFVNEDSVFFIRNLIKEDLNIKTITYSYNNHFITMSNFEQNKSVRKIIYILYSIFKKDSPQRKIENFSSIFLTGSNTTFIFDQMFTSKFNQHTLSTYLNENRLESIGFYYPEVKIKENFIFYLQSLNLISYLNWYIIGKIKGAIDNKFKLIPLKYIDRDISLYRLYCPELTLKNKLFISLNNAKFTSDDVGAYLIYKTKHGDLKIFAQITDVHKTKDNNQILFLQLLTNSYKPYNTYIYKQYSSSPIEEGDLSKQLVPYETVTLEESSLTGQEHSNSEQHNPLKRPNTDYASPENSKLPRSGENYKILLKFTCKNINELGDYKFNDVIIHVTKIDNQDIASEMLVLYDIKGTYTYGRINREFYSCHNGNESSNNKPYLIINNKNGEGFYPYNVLLPSP